MFQTRFLSALMLCLLAGCAAVPPAPGPGDWNQFKAERQELQNWKMTGRAAVATASEGWSASLDWQQRQRETQLRLYGPFGVGALRVTSDGQSLQIETSKGESFAGDEATAMLEQTLGTALPLQPLRYWLLGVPEPLMPALAQFNEKGHLGQLDQGGWRVHYERYERFDNQWLPARLNLQNGDIKVKVVVQKWQLNR